MYCSSNTRKSCDQTAAGTTAVRTQTDTPDIATDAGPDMARIWHRYGTDMAQIWHGYGGGVLAWLWCVSSHHYHLGHLQALKHMYIYWGVIITSFAIRKTPISLPISLSVSPLISAALWHRFPFRWLWTLLYEPLDPKIRVVKKCDLFSLTGKMEPAIRSQVSLFQIWDPLI